MLHSYGNGEWYVLDRTDDYVADVVDAVSRIGAENVTYDQVAAVAREERVAAGLRAEAGIFHGLVLILGNHTETLPTGAKIGWVLWVGETNWGTAACWHVGLMVGEGTIQVASVQARDYVLGMLRAAGGV